MTNIDEIINIAGCYTEDLSFSGKILTTINAYQITEINSRFKKECEYLDLSNKTAEINQPIIPIY